MIDMIPIKIKVTKGADGRFVYPKFKQTLKYFKDNPDYKGESLYYDKVYDCKVESLDSPIGMRWCMKLVPVEFAQQAVAAFPDTVSIMTDVEAEDFYNNRAVKHLSDKNYNLIVLDGLQKELELKTALNLDTTDLKVEIAKAIDPEDETPGVTINKEKTWTGMKTLRGINIVSL